MNFSELIAKGTVVGDGAMGTELQRAGLEIGECGERWVLEHPERIEAIHASYLAAGSQAIITNSFGANRWVLGRYGLADRVEDVNRGAAATARRAAGSGALVLGDIGPCGGFLRPLGDVNAADLEAEFVRQAGALLEGGADGIVIETMSALEEVVAAVRAARRAGARLVAASLAFDRLPNGNLRTMMGVSPEQAAGAIAAEGADIVGANCGTKMDTADFARVVLAFRSASRLPVMIQANAGTPELVEGQAVYRLSPEGFAAGMIDVVAAGASFVGGCCGTTPAHIAALAATVRGSGGNERA